MPQTYSITGNIVDPVNRKIYGGTLEITDGKISSIRQHEVSEGPFILPGFVDAHIHIESSMLTPYEFARMAMPHGTVATISDPHEIANVCGMEGIRYMLQNARRAPLKFHFGAPSCVPATTFETAGAVITAEDIETLFRDDGLIYLAEVMNYPGVLHRDPLVMDKIDVAKRYGRRIDGHAPGLRADDAAHYIAAGISTDHECFSLRMRDRFGDYGLVLVMVTEVVGPVLRRTPRESRKAVLGQASRIAAVLPAATPRFLRSVLRVGDEVLVLVTDESEDAVRALLVG